MATSTSTIAKTIYVPQPDTDSCQSACIAMALGTTDVQSIRAELVTRASDTGNPSITAGTPSIMESYLQPRVKSYQYLMDGSLNDAKKALDEGCIVITHGWFTNHGHVILLIGYEPDPTTLSYRFIVHDPYAEYNFPRGDFDDDKTGEGVRYSSYGIYATCVASYGYDHSCEIYRQKQLDSNNNNAYLHIVKR